MKQYRQAAAVLNLIYLGLKNIRSRHRSNPRQGVIYFHLLQHTLDEPSFALHFSTFGGQFDSVALFQLGYFLHFQSYSLSASCLILTYHRCQ